MDPYVERPEIWPDFHDRFIAALCGQLQPLLRPRYVALTQDRLYILESERSRWPDVAVVHSPLKSPTVGTTAVLDVEPDTPAVFELVREEVRQPLIHIVETAAGNRLVTALEVPGPDNKQPGEGRTSYLEKREEYRRGGANLVEIDLLRGGQPTVRVSQTKLASLKPWRYLVAVTRQQPSVEEVYHFRLEQRLPRIKVPLANDDPDAVLDLQAAFSRTWQEGPYPELLFYDQPPPGTLMEDEAAWVQSRLNEAGV
jgi:hypothetical protein